MPETPSGSSTLMSTVSTTSTGNSCALSSKDSVRPRGRQHDRRCPEPKKSMPSKNIYEPYLLQIGFLQRTPRAASQTRLAYEHLGIAYRPPQAGLF